MAGKLNTNPWLKMWVKPRETIREIIQVDPKYHIYLLSGIYGFATLLHFSQNFSLGAYLPWGAVLLGSLVFSVFIGLIGFGIAGKLIEWTGRLLGGKGSFQQIRAALAWSNVTNIVSILMWLLLVASFRGAVFLESFAESTFVGSALAVVLLAFLVQAVASVWGFVILVKSIGEVQGFSAWKGLLNVVIVFILVAIIVWILAWIFWWSQGSTQLGIVQ
ncbi:MAG: Yip1 family protein [Chlamydiota bacterium]